jgi:hypothetical protein
VHESPLESELRRASLSLLAPGGDQAPP